MGKISHTRDRQLLRRALKREGGSIGIALNAPPGYSAVRHNGHSLCSGNKKDALHFRKSIPGKVKVKKVRIEWGGKKRGSIFCLYKKGR